MLRNEESRFPHESAFLFQVVREVVRESGP